jgi:4-hydroxybenzoate polyprenyltransferase
MSGLRDWCRLLRIAGLPTVAANAATAATCALYAGATGDPAWIVQRLVAGGPAPWLTLAAGACLYLAGMVWNDVIDVGRDRLLHPGRPLPAGRISLLAALVAGAGLLVAGPVLAFIAHRWLGLALAGLVLALILLYTFWTKAVPLAGALTLGAVRASHAAFAILLAGPDLARIALTDVAGTPTLPAYALLLGCWITGIAWVAELESRPAARWELLASGGAVLTAAAAATAWALQSGTLPHLFQAGIAGPVLGSLGAGLVLVLAVSAAIAFAAPWMRAVRSGQAIGAAVGAGLAATILLDAAIAAAHQPLVGLGILLLYPVQRALTAVGRMD